MLVHLFGFEDAATYKQWQALGRQVKRGSTAIYLMRPNLKLARVTDEETGEERTVQAGLRGFGWFPVHGLEDTFSWINRGKFARLKLIPGAGMR